MDNFFVWSKQNNHCSHKETYTNFFNSKIRCVNWCYNESNMAEAKQKIYPSKVPSLTAISFTVFEAALISIHQCMQTWPVQLTFCQYSSLQ